MLPSREIKITFLKNGNYFVTYSVDGKLEAQRYSSNGNSQGSPIRSGGALEIYPLAGGGYVIQTYFVHRSIPSIPQWWVKVYSADGVNQEKTIVSAEKMQIYALADEGYVIKHKGFVTLADYVEDISSVARSKRENWEVLAFGEDREPRGTPQKSEEGKELDVHVLTHGGYVLQYYKEGNWFVDYNNSTGEITNGNA